MNPSDVLTATADSAAAHDPLDDILRQIVSGYFVLTDGQGSVSKWSEPAELLFGREAPDVLGQSFFDTLTDGQLNATGQAWRRFLESAEPPEAPGRVPVNGLHADGHGFPMEVVFVPVKLDEGFDFSLFLEDLGFELPMNLMLMRMRQQHPVVVRALRQAIDDEPAPWEGWRTAGTLVVFRPLAPTPWIEAELAAREAARAEADAGTEERLTNLDPGIHGTSVNDLDDAAAVVARLLSALERIDELERMATSLPAQVDEARREAEARVAAAEQETAALRAELQRGLSGEPAAPDAETLARIERLERSERDRAELAARLDAIESAREESAAAADARLQEGVRAARERAEEAMAEAAAAMDARLAELERTGSEGSEAAQADVVARLDRVRAEHEETTAAIREELAATVERLEREREREAVAARAELAAALERLEDVEREAEGLRERLAAVTVERHEAEGLSGDDRRHLDALRDEAAALRERLDELAAAPVDERLEELRSAGDATREQLAAARGEAEAAAQRVEALRSEQEATLAHVQARLDELEAGEDEGLADELAAVRAELEQLHRAGEDRFEALRAEQLAAEERLAALQAEQVTAHEGLEGLRRAQDEVRAALEDVRRERDEFRLAADQASNQLADVRRTLAEHESSPRIPAELAVHRHEVDKLRAAEQALRSRVEELAAAGQAATHRLEELTRAGEAVTERLDAAEAAGSAAGERLEELAAAAAELRAALAEAQEQTTVAAEQAASAAERAHALEQRTDARLDDVLEAGDALAGRVEALGTSVDQRGRELATRLQELESGLEDHARSAGETRHAMAEMAERIDAIDNGAGSVLADVRGLHERLEELSGDAGDLDELRAGMARLGTELEAAQGRLDRVEQESADTRRAFEAGLAKLATELQAAAAAADAAGERARAAEESATSASAAAGEDVARRMSELDARAQGLRAELTAGRGRLEALDGAVTETRAAVEAGDAALREEIAEVRSLAETAGEVLDALRAEMAEVRGAAEAMHSEAERARATTKAGEERIEAMSAEVTFALKSIEDLKQGLTSAGQAAVIARREAEQAKRAAQTAGEGAPDHVTQVFQQLLGMANGRNASRRPSSPGLPTPKRQEAVAREPRHGFDDVSQPLALLGLDGRFRELNPAFSRLVGYKETEFAKAAWPSPHDRRDYQDQQEQLRRLAAGEVECVPVQSTYMHGQGLMVPVVGKLTAVAGEDGLPLHLLLEAEERHTH